MSRFVAYNTEKTLIFNLRTGRVARLNGRRYKGTAAVMNAVRREMIECWRGRWSIQWRPSIVLTKAKGVGMDSMSGGSIEMERGRGSGI